MFLGYLKQFRLGIKPTGNDATGYSRGREDFFQSIYLFIRRERIQVRMLAGTYDLNTFSRKMLDVPGESQSRPVDFRNLDGPGEPFDTGEKFQLQVFVLFVKKRTDRDARH
jgi:hypothetical protein